MTTDEMRALAEAATPGPWSHWQSGGIHQIDAGTKTVVHWAGFDQLQTPNEKTAIKNNADWIAAANPSAIIALLDRVKALEEGLLFYANHNVYQADSIGRVMDVTHVARALLENKQ